MKKILIISLFFLLFSCGKENIEVKENDSNKIINNENTGSKISENKNIDFNGKCNLIGNYEFNGDKFGNFIMIDKEIGFSIKEIHKEYLGYIYYDKNGKMWYKTKSNLFGPYNSDDRYFNFHNQGFIVIYDSFLNNKNGEYNDKLIFIYNDEVKLIYPFKGYGIPEFFFKKFGKDEFIGIQKDGKNGHYNNYIVYKNYKKLGDYSYIYFNNDIFLGYNDSKWESISDNGQKIVDYLNKNHLFGWQIYSLLINKDHYAIELINYKVGEKSIDSKHKIIKDGDILSEFDALYDNVYNYSNTIKKKLSYRENISIFKILFSDDGNSFTYIKNENNKMVIVKDGKVLLKSNYIIGLAYKPNSTDLYFISDDTKDDISIEQGYYEQKQNPIYLNSNKTDITSSSIINIDFDKDGNIIDENKLDNQLNNTSNKKNIAIENLKSFGYKEDDNFELSSDNKSMAIMYSSGNINGIIKDFKKYYESVNKLDHYYIGNNYIIEENINDRKKLTINGVKENNLIDNYEIFLDYNNDLNIIYYSKENGINQLKCNFN